MHIEAVSTQLLVHITRLLTVPFIEDVNKSQYSFGRPVTTTVMISLNYMVHPFIENVNKFQNLFGRLVAITVMVSLDYMVHLEESKSN